MNYKLRNCYNKIKQKLGDSIEPYDSVALVEDYRQYWKPKKNNMRIILLAESHVFTSDEDRQIMMPQLPELPRYPRQYAKFVYCLAYGERDLTGKEAHPAKDGTRQFWKIFYSCNNYISKSDDLSSIQSGDYKERLNSKIRLLKDLRRNGIWLVDSSIVALYNKGKKPKKAVIASVIRASWEGYIKGVIEQAKPEHIICIGKGVAEELETDIRRLVNSYTVIAQPNARLTTEEHMTNYKMYSKICFTPRNEQEPEVVEKKDVNSKDEAPEQDSHYMGIRHGEQIENIPTPTVGTTLSGDIIRGRLPVALVYLIRFSYHNRKITDVAKAFGTTCGKVSDILHRRTFTHINERFKPTAQDKADALSWMRRHPYFERGAVQEVIGAVKNMDEHG